jgi:hypothetical protein
MHLKGVVVVEHRIMLCYPLSCIYPLEAVSNVWKTRTLKRCYERFEHSHFARVYDAYRNHEGRELL